jgi:dTDP-4-amino-4,6-dideoxy-D-galactose acyltransferase
VLHVKKIEKMSVSVPPHAEPFIKESSGGVWMTQDSKNPAIAALSLRKWDTDFFNKKMGQVHFFNMAPIENLEPLLKEVESYASKNNYQHLMIRANGPLPENISAFLKKHKFNLIDQGSIFEKKTCSTLVETPLIIHPLETSDLSLVQELAKRAFRLSYFYRDSFFSESEANRLHGQWVANLFANESSRIWVAKEGDTFLGFVSGTITAKTGKIPLIAVEKEAGRKKIGSHLLDTIMNWFYEMGCETVEVKTQSGNLAAVNLYLKNRFRKVREDFTFSKSL